MDQRVESGSRVSPYFSRKKKPINFIAPSQCRVVPYTFDFADPCLDKMIEVLEFKSAGAKQELVNQAVARGEGIKSDIRALSSRVGIC